MIPMARRRLVMIFIAPFRFSNIRLALRTDFGCATIRAWVEHLGTVDEFNKVISTPAYMLGQSISEVADGIENSIASLLKMLEN